MQKFKLTRALYQASSFHPQPTLVQIKTFLQKQVHEFASLAHHLGERLLSDVALGTRSASFSESSYSLKTCQHFMDVCGAGFRHLPMTALRRQRLPRFREYLTVGMESTSFLRQLIEWLQVRQRRLEPIRSQRAERPLCCNCSNLAVAHPDSVCKCLDSLHRCLIPIW